MHKILSKGENLLTCKHSGRPMSPRTASIASAWSARKSLYLFANPLNNKLTKCYKFLYCAIKTNLAKPENDVSKEAFVLLLLWELHDEFDFDTKHPRCEI